LRQETSAEIVGRSNVLRVRVADRERSRAVALVQRISEEYLSTVSTASVPSASLAQGDQAPPIKVSVLVPASSLEDPLQPKPLRALAGGTLLGLLAAVGVILLLWRPWGTVRSSPYWK
jgi:uncharacterized protein involved in exopolysaccharide biosynthesis